MSDRTHRQLKTVSNGLLVYGIVGIVLTVILLGITVTVGSRLDTLSSRLTSRLETISVTIDKTATTLEAGGLDLGQLLLDDRPGRDDDRPGRMRRSARWSRPSGSSRRPPRRCRSSARRRCRRCPTDSARIATQLETLQGRVGDARDEPREQPGQPDRARVADDRPGHPAPGGQRRPPLGRDRGQPERDRVASSGWHSGCWRSGSPSRPSRRSAFGDLDPPSAGAPRRSRPELHRRKRQLQRATLPGDPERDLAADDLIVEQSLEVGDALDRPAVELEDQVARPDARGGCRAAIEELDDLERPCSARARGRAAAEAAACHRRCRGRPAGRVRRG